MNLIQSDAWQLTTHQREQHLYLPRYFPKTRPWKLRWYGCLSLLGLSWVGRSQAGGAHRYTNSGGNRGWNPSQMAPFQFRLSPRRFKASSTLTGPLCILPRKLGWWSRRRKTMSWINWINPSGSWWQLSRRQSRRWHSIHGWCHRGCWGLCGSWNCWSHWDSLMSLVVLPWLHLKMPLHEQLASYLHEQLTSQLQA